MSDVYPNGDRDELRAAEKAGNSSQEDGTYKQDSTGVQRRKTDTSNICQGSLATGTNMSDVDFKGDRDESRVAKKIGNQEEGAYSNGVELVYSRESFEETSGCGSVKRRKTDTSNTCQGQEATEYTADRTQSTHDRQHMAAVDTKETQATITNITAEKTINDIRACEDATKRSITLQVNCLGASIVNVAGIVDGDVGCNKDTKVPEEEPLTAARKIRKRTESRIQSLTKDMVDTAALMKVTEKLDRVATWVTIKGRPGEGKSTIAYMALKDHHLHGKQVYQVVSPEEFNEVITACADPVIMLDDIFGDLEFDAAEWAKWRPSLQPFVDVNYPDTDTEPKSAEIPTCLERTKGEQTQVKRTGPNKGKAIIILVGRDYVLKSSLPDLGRMADYISSPQYVVEVISQRDVDERKKIWHVHAKTKHIDFDESTVSRICQADCPHGFPHVCKMFVTAYEHDHTQAQVEAFFKSPLAFLTNTLEKFLQDEIKRSLFMAMIKGDGKISVQELEEDGNLGYKCITAAEKLVGSYLKKEDGTYVFDHPSISDSVTLILSTTQPKFVTENCSLTFIHQRIRLRPSSKSGENVACETDLGANIPWTCARHLARRFATEIERSNLLHVLSHQACCIAEFVELLMDCVKTEGHMSVPDILKLTDKSSRKSFCELLPSNKSFHLIKFIMETENVSFSQSEIRDILHGVCMNAACSVLTYISEHMKLDINDRHDWKEQTPLMLAARTQDSEFVNQILSLDPDLYARDVLDLTVFHYLCEYGLTSTVESTINMGVDVKKHYMSSDKACRESWHKSYSNNLPLYRAIHRGGAIAAEKRM